MSTKIPSSLTWLIKKRARLDGRIKAAIEKIEAAERLTKELPGLKADLAALDRTLRLHEIAVDPKNIKSVAAHAQKRVMLPYGALTRTLLTRLRDSKDIPLSTDDLTLHVITQFVHIQQLTQNADDLEALRTAVRHRLKNLAADGAIVRMWEGRYRNTTTDSALLLNTSGCLICGEPFEVIASATIAVPGENASLSAVRLCSKHMEEAGKAPSLMNYLAQAFKIPFIAESLKRTPQEVLLDGSRIMQEKLGMEVFDIGEENIKAKTKNGTVLIYRYEHGLNYGYMINGPQNEQLMRIDSADHHRVEVGPDHLHPDLRNKLPPVSSYTMGDLCFDWPLINRLINEWESTLVVG